MILRTMAQLVCAFGSSFRLLHIWSVNLFEPLYLVVHRVAFATLRLFAVYLMLVIRGRRGNSTGSGILRK
jgi:hypothetical protein